MKLHGGIAAYRPPKPRITSKGKVQKAGLSRLRGGIQGGGLTATNQGAPGAGPPHPGAAPTPDYRDSQYYTDVANANRQHDLSESQLQQQRFQTQTEYGLDQGFNDPTANPFSRAALLQRTYDQNKAKTVNSYAGQGQLYSSSLGGAQAYDAYNNQQGYDALSKAYQSQLLGYTNQGNQLDLDQNLAIGNASAEALGRRVSQTPDPSEAAPPDTSQDDLNSRLMNFKKRTRNRKRRRK